MFEKIENIKRPIKKGEIFLVPCITRYQKNIENWVTHKNGKRGDAYFLSYQTKIFITPIINHPHNDIENGQKEIHYHVDYRFVKHKNDGIFPTVKRKHSAHYFVEYIRPQKEIHGKIEYILLPVINESLSGITNPELIKNSNLKHSCIYKNKCPHRGYDLSQVNAINGIITCPLHGLQFDAETKKIINTKASD